MNTNKELLFGILAVQLKGVPPARMVEAGAGWITDPAISIAQRLVDGGILSEADRKQLEDLVENAVLAHGGDVEETLFSFGGAEQVRNTFGPGFDTAELDAMKTSPMTDVAFDAGTGPMISGVEEAPGRYTVVSQHAKGGMGRVLLVHDEFLGRSVALKELLPAGHPAASADQRPTPVRQTVSLVSRFLQEARITGQLEHPSIVPVYELGRRKDGTFYYTMKLVRGKTLAQAMRDCATMSERMALLPRLVDLCEAIAYAHDRGVIHRDIKPANVMVGQFGETVVLDWGLAKVRDTEDIYVEDIENTLQFLHLESGETALPETAYGRALGTPHYMSPEQAEGHVDIINERSDIYSLGAVLYEILTGSTPHSGKNTKEILDNVIKSRPAPVLTIAPDVPPPLAEICHKAIRKDPRERYASALELAEDIQCFIAGSLVKAYQYSLGETLAHHYRKHRAAVNVAIGALLLLAAVGVISYVKVVQARDREHAQRLIAEDAQQKEAAARGQAERSGYLSQLALIQEYLHDQQSELAFKTAAETLPAQRNWEWGFLLNQTRPERRLVHTDPHYAAAVAISPDGATAAAVMIDGTVQFYDAETGKLLREADTVGFPPAAAPKFSPDGARLVTAGHDEYVRVWEVSSGKLLHTLKGHAGKVIYAEFSPDGRQIVSAALDGVASLWDADQGTALPAPETGMTTLRKALFSPDGAFLAAVSGEGQVKLWRRSDFSEFLQCPGRDIVFAEQRPLCAVTVDGTVTLWDLGTATQSRVLAGEGLITQVRFNRQGNRVLAASLDGAARLWSADSGELLRVFQQDTPLDGALFGQEEAVVITLGRNNQFAAWDARTGYVLNRMNGNGRALGCFDGNRGGTRLVTASNEALLEIWDPLYRPGCQRVASGIAPCMSLSVSEKTGLAAAISPDALHLFSLKGNEREKRFPLLRGWGGGSNVALSSDGARMAATIDLVTPSIWNFENDTVVQLAGHHSTVASLAFDAENRRVATCAVDGSIAIWDAATGERMLSVDAHAGPVNSVRFSLDGQRILSAATDKIAAVWSADTGQRLLALQGHEHAVLDAIFDNTGSRIFTASEDRTIRIWNAETGALMGVWNGQGEGVFRISLDTENRTLLSLSYDGIAKLIDIATGEPLIRFPGVKDALRLPDSSRLLLTNTDGRLEVLKPAPWQAASDKNGNAENLETALRSYQDGDYQEIRGQLLPETIPSGIYVLRSSQLARQAFERWRDAWNPSSMVFEPDRGLLLDIFDAACPISILGFERGDRLLGLAGKPRLTPEQIAAFLESMAAALKNAAPLDLVFDVTRDTAPISVHIYVRPGSTETRTFSISQGDARELIRAFANGAANFKASQSSSNSPLTQTLCEAGVGIGVDFSQHDEALASKIGISLRNRLTYIDNTAISGYDSGYERLVDLGEAIEKGTKAFSVGLQQGEFVQTRLDITIQ